MKNKVIMMIILAIFIISASVSTYNVQATTEEGIEKTSDEVKNETSEGEESKEDEWTDFSNAQISLKKEGVSDAVIEISGVTADETKSTYYLCITSNGNKPDVTSVERINMSCDESKKILKTRESDKVAEYIEKNQDLYVSVIERNFFSDNENVVMYGKKINRYAESKYSDAFYATLMMWDADQIVTNFTHSEANNRKLQIKVGKITDNAILQKIKNKDSSGFANLLSYAKSNPGIYNQTLNADKDDWFAMEYNAGDGKGTGTGNQVIDINGIENNAYYYLYVKTDDENGKYISNEAVTLSLAHNNYNDNWALFFYGSEDFDWADFGEVTDTGDGNGSVTDEKKDNVQEEKKDNTTASGKLPQTGVRNYVILGVVVLALIGIISYKKYQKYNF